MIYWFCRGYDEQFTRRYDLLKQFETADENRDTFFRESMKTSISV
jgi:hypothetical protein